MDSREDAEMQRAHRILGCRSTATILRLWNAILEVDRFVRLHFFVFSGLLPLLGASTVRRDLTGGQIAALLSVALCFHVYSYVLNDVMDLPIDRTEPQRQQDPLVRGAIAPGVALTIALIPIPLTVPLTVWLGGGPSAYTTLAAGFALMAVYNIWGKHCRVPPLTDCAQGVAWGSLALYAAVAVGGEPNVLTWAVATYATGFLLFINGIHGGLRDLDNDIASGAHTTAIFLGTRPGPRGSNAYVPTAVSAFASIVLAGLLSVAIVPLLRNDFRYEGPVRIATLIGAGSLGVAAVMLQPAVVRGRRPAFDAAFRLQAYAVLVMLPLIFMAYVSVVTRLMILLLLMVSLMVSLGWTTRVVRWLWLSVAQKMVDGDAAVP
jgi:4-hydroxybenzoate polyprenyltransferase